MVVNNGIGERMDSYEELNYDYDLDECVTISVQAKI